MSATLKDYHGEWPLSELPQELRRRANVLARSVGRGTATQVTIGEVDRVIESRRYYWTTPNGTLCRHPCAYTRAWGKPVYHGSECHVELAVSEEDFARLALEALAAKREEA